MSDEINHLKRQARAELAEMQTAEKALTRRDFLKAIVATAVVGSTVGAGTAAVGSNVIQTLQTPSVTTIIQPLSHNMSALNVTSQTESLARLASVQAENIRLQSELDAAKRQLDTMQKSARNNGEQSSTTISELHIELDSAHGQIGALSGLVALYEQVESIDFDDALRNGLSAVDEQWQDWSEHMPTLAESIQAGQQALEAFESQVPLVENGRLWLHGHLGKVEGYYASVEYVLTQAVQVADNFLQMLNQWFQDLLSWLPFGMGEKTRNVMNALHNLLAETPHTITGLRTNLIDPLGKWFDDEDGEMKLQTDLIRPLREKTLTQAQTSLQKSETMRQTYEVSLAEPVQVALEQKEAVRAQIALYKEKHLQS